MKIWLLLFMVCFFSLSLEAQIQENCLLDNESKTSKMTKSKNVLGTALKSCCFDPMTGFYRDGFCQTGPTDYGTHVVCARMTEAFLTYTKNKGNDLSTPLPMYNFPGLKPGDQWCLCVSRWREAMVAGVAPPVILQATHERALDVVTMEDLKKYAILPKEMN